MAKISLVYFPILKAANQQVNQKKRKYLALFETNKIT